MKQLKDFKPGDIVIAKCSEEIFVIAVITESLSDMKDLNVIPDIQRLLKLEGIAEC